MARLPRAVTGSRDETVGNPIPPIESYAAAAPNRPLTSRYGAGTSTIRTRSPVVDRRPRMNGMRFFYVHGGTDMRTPGMSLPQPGGMDGRVASSQFQHINVTLHDWVQNDALFQAGYPRNLGLAQGVPQPHTSVTGGPTSARMQQSPMFTRVQVVPRYSTTPQVYETRGSVA